MSRPREAASDTGNVTLHRAVRNALYHVSPSVGEKCAHLWDVLQPVFRGRMSVRGAAKYIVRGLCPGLGGKFTYFGTRVYFPKASFIFRSTCEAGTWEPEVTAWLCRSVEPDKTFIDVGANIGLISVPVLRAVPNSHVLSIEPSPNSVPYLTRTCGESGFQDRWQIVAKVASDSVGRAQFFTTLPCYGAWDGLRDTGLAGARSLIEVNQTTVDTEWKRLGCPPVSCMKIDVEGGEGNVLKGSEEMVRSERPHVLLEWSRENLASHGMSAGFLLDYANSHEYDLLAFPSLNPIAGVHALELEMLNTEMFLLVPQQTRLSSFNGDRADLDLVVDAAPATVSLPDKTESLFKDAENYDEHAEHFATDHLLTDIKERTIWSAAVTATAQVTQFILMLVSTMVLARLLTPHDFGLVAMVTTVIGFFRIFNEAGLSTATVQREGITHAQVSNLFWTNVAVGATISLILAMGAPVVAWFYREPQLVSITLALCITFLFTTSTVQHLALLKRQMRFKMVALIQTSSVFAGILTGITMALLNFGYWSLVGMQIATPLTALLVTWSVSRWRPQLPRRQSGTGSLLSFGANLTASSFLWSLARGSDALLIGRVYGSASIGLYSRAAALIARPVEQFLPPIESVFVPMLSRLQNQPERYRRVLLQAYEVIAITSFLFGGLLLALAYPLTLFVLGPKWEKAASIFAGFTLVAAYSPFSSMSTWLLTSQGRGRDFLRLSVINSSVTVASFLVGLPFGPAGVALSYSASCLLILLPVVHYIAGRQGPVRTMDLWGRFFTHLPLWFVISGSAWLSRFLIMGSPPSIQLLVRVPIGLAAGAIFISIFPPARRVVLRLIHTLQELRACRESSA